MANPTIVTVLTTWTLVASGKFSGVVNVTDNSGTILGTYREAGGAAPTDPDDDGKAVFINQNQFELSHSSAADFYLRNTQESVDVAVSV